MPADMEKVKEESKNKREKVLEFLREHDGKGFTGEEIEERTGVSISDAIPNRFPRFERIETTRHQGEVLYYYKFDWAGVLFFVGIVAAIIGFSLTIF